ncbi:nucleoside kinase [bacterium]|nr:nucleoside kinase [bacterium]
MSKLVKITISVGEEQKKISYPVGTTLETVAKEHQTHWKNRILGAVLDNRLMELRHELQKDDSQLKFISYEQKDGRLFYLRSLSFMLIHAAKALFPHAELHVEYSLGNGIYCYFSGLTDIRSDEVEEIEKKMRRMVKSNLPFIRQEVPTKEAVELFKKQGMDDKVLLLSLRRQKMTSVYSLGDLQDYFYGYLVPSTDYLEHFHITSYRGGIMLMLPSSHNPTTVPALKDSPKLFNVIRENNSWLDILKLDTCGKLNRNIQQGFGKSIMLIAEALHEKKLASIADEILRRKEVLKVISIAGPSSSGKTTSANRLAVQLRVNGMYPRVISLDNYFKDREETPLDKNGEHDFETIDAIRIDLFNQHLNALFDGQEIEIPHYNFKSGKPEKRGNKLKLEHNTILIIEGIHGLNPKLYRDVPMRKVFKMYVSALSALNIDYHNRIPTTDCRMIRRLVRDNKYRAHSASETIGRWPSVRRGEDRYIFPYQENADVMFNSGLVYELSVLKKHALPLLEAVQKDDDAYIEAKRLIKFLSFFEDFTEEAIPPNSILREFVGGSIFRDYPC